MMENSNQADAFPCGVANPHAPGIDKGIRFINSCYKNQIKILNYFLWFSPHFLPRT